MTQNRFAVAMERSCSTLSSVEEVERDNQFGKDFRFTTTEGSQFTVAYGGSFEDIGATHIRIKVGSLGNARAPHLLNSEADYYAFYNAKIKPPKFMVFPTKKLAELLKGEIERKRQSFEATSDKSEAIINRKLYMKKVFVNGKYVGQNDIVIYVPISEISESISCKTIDIPEIVYQEHLRCLEK